MNEHAKDKVKKQFSRNAQKYVESVSHATSNDLNVLIEWLEPKLSSLLLDIATGGGHVVKKLAPMVKTVFVTDLTKAMLANTKEHLKDHDNLAYIIADAEELPFLDQSFDLVTCRIAPHHFPNPNKFIEEVARVLTPDGKFVLIDNVVPDDHELATFMNTFEKLRDDSHVRCLSLTEWMNLFADNQLSVTRSQIEKKVYDFPVWVERTTENQVQVNKVNDYICQSAPEIKAYYQVEETNGKIKKVTVDQCMVMCEKMKKSSGSAH